MRRALLRTPVLAAAALGCSLALAASAAATAGPPHASTGNITNARGATVELTGAVSPHELETTYFFQYGPTVAYGHQTPAGKPVNGAVSVRVGQIVSGFLAGYHYRLVAHNALGTALGRDRTYKPKSTKLHFEVVKPTEPPPLGSPITISGTLAGVGGANHRIALQASPFPYLEPFAQLGLPTLTGPTGRFTFHVGLLTRSTQFRVMTLDTLPLFSRILTEHVAVRVTLKIKPSGRRGFVRLFGQVYPSEVGAKVLFQVQKPARPGHTQKTEERTFAYATQASTTVKRATRTFSRFSQIVNLRRTGLYRAYVVVRSGPLVSGGSHTLYIRAAARKK